MARTKSLDGIRAISILMVTAGHALLTLPASVGENKVVQLFSNAALGVQIFFVISGYLITKLLLLERKKTGKIDLKGFYIRRVLRIFPVFFLYLITLVLLKYSLMPEVFRSYSLILFAALYLWNYKHYFKADPAGDNGNFYMAHFWSLSMEEQFYLLWPITFIRNRKNLIKITIAIMLLIPLVRIASYFLMPGSRPQVTMMLHTGGDTIIMGCFGALLEQTNTFKNSLVPILKSNLLILAVALFLFVLSPLLSMYLKGMYALTVGQSLNNLCIMALIFWAIYIPSAVSTALNSKILVHTGILSYSIYIWQPLILNHKTNFWINQFPQNILVVMAIAFLSYYAIEKPLLNLKKRFSANLHNT